MSGTPIKALCVTSHPDLPEAATFVGLAAQGFAMRVFCDPGAATFAMLDSSAVDVAPFVIDGRFDAKAVQVLREEIDALRPDILHLFNNRAVLNGLRAARGRTLKIVAYRGNVGNVSVFDPLAWLRYLNPRVDRIVCVSDAVRDSLAGVGFARWRIPAAKLVTIRKGHDLAWYDGVPLSRAELGLPAHAFVVGCVANWRPRKGIEVLIDACERLATSCPVYLVLVGDMGSSRIAQKIAASTLAGRIRLLGHRRDVPAVTAAFDVGVLPALKREGLPKTVIESMACGVATVATRVAGVPEIIENGRSGVIVPPGDAAALADAVLRLYEDPALRAALGRRGRERIGEALRIDQTIAQTASLYETLCRD